MNLDTSIKRIYSYLSHFCLDTYTNMICVIMFKESCIGNSSAVVAIISVSVIDFVRYDVVYCRMLQ